MDSVLMDPEKINPPMTRPSIFCSFAALTTTIISFFCFFLATDAAPEMSYRSNPLSLLCGGVFVASLLLVVIPILFKWDWRTTYFGFSLIHCGSLAMFGLIPWMCILFYSHLPFGIRVVGFSLYFIILIWWCSRFVKVYNQIFSVAEARDQIYVQVEGTFFYRQKADKIILKKRKFSQFPSGFFVAILMLSAVSMLPFAREISSFFGLPFIHIFLAVAAIPTDMMALGLLTRGFMIYYFYPRKIFLKNRALVYVDLFSG